MTRLDTPVLFLIFNQPEITMRTFKEIRKARPARFFISADGPREVKSGEDEECEATRKAVLSAIDWECEVKTRFLESNLGCKAAVTSGISWFLDLAGEGIILEYDCVPDPTFFTFCENLLTRYRGEDRVMAICGSNYQLGNTRGSGSYYFSRIPSAWGWATWKRAWQHWDGTISKFPAFQKESHLERVFPSKLVREYWNSKFEQVFKGIDRTWGFPWVFSVLARDGVCATSNVNLVTNIGFTERATNAVDKSNTFANAPRAPISMPLSHPQGIEPDIEADEYFSLRLSYVRPTESLVKGIKRAMLAIIPRRFHPSLKSLYQSRVRG